MSKQQLELLTESMFYVLMSLLSGEKYGIEIAGFVEATTKGRVTVGPGTLYTILGKYEKAGYIVETAVVGRRRTYAITKVGKDAYVQEVIRLKSVLEDVERQVNCHEEENCF